MSSRDNAARTSSRVHHHDDGGRTTLTTQLVVMLLSYCQIFIVPRVSVWDSFNSVLYIEDVDQVVKMGKLFIFLYFVVTSRVNKSNQISKEY